MSSRHTRPSSHAPAAEPRLELLEFALDQVREAVYLVDEDSQFCYVSAEACRSLGYSREELLAMRLCDIDPEWKPERKSEGWDVVKRLGSVEIRSQHRRKDGSFFPIEVTASFVQFGGEEYVIAMVRDITERTRMEAQLHARAEEFRALAENGPDIVIRYDRNYRRIYVNSTMARLTGASPERLLGGKPSDSEHLLLSSPQQYEAVIRDVFVSGEPRELVFSWRNANGDAVWSHGRFEAERDAAGHITSVLSICRDVTALKSAELQWRTLVENLPGMVMRFDPAGRVLFANPQMLAAFGETEQSIASADLGSDNQGRPLLGIVREVAASGAPSSCELSRATRSGMRHFDLRVAPERDENGELRSVLGIASDVTELVENHQMLQRLNRALTTLSSGNEALVRATDEDELLAEMCRVLVTVGRYQLAWIGFSDADGPLSPKAWAGDEASLRGVIQYLGNEGPPLLALRTGEPQLRHDLDWHIADHASGTPTRPLRACAAFPIALGSDAPGVLAIYAADAAAFDWQEVGLLAEMANDLAYGIHALRARADRELFMERLRASMQSTIQALSNTVELRDPYTAGHQRRVAALSTAIARQLGWTEERINMLHLTALVHDIGKIAVPSEILSKPGRLSTAELNLVRTHAEAGYGILKSVEFPWPIADHVRQHHERLDGTGYPLGLKDEAISPEARVLAVADVVEAMTTHRPYRPGLGIELALEEIQRHRGSHFDPEVVDACIRLIREQGFQFQDAEPDGF